MDNLTVKKKSADSPPTVINSQARNQSFIVTFVLLKISASGNHINSHNTQNKVAPTSGEKIPAVVC